MEDNNGFVSGFAAIVGRPNVGKSTLLNGLAKMRLAIVSQKPQTTRHNIKYIHDADNMQIVFTDTPGLHSPKTKFGERMMEQATAALKDADVILLLIDATDPRITDTEKRCFEIANNLHKQLILLINKCDMVEKRNILPIIEKFSLEHEFAEIVPISALKKIGIDDLLDVVKRRLPIGPRYYPEDSLTDQTERDISSELIREQILRFTSDEIPHGVAVEIERFKEYSNGEELDNDSEIDRKLIKISAVVYCEKDSHKKMLIGKNGDMIKRIGTEARLRIEQLVQCKVHLELFVKVRKDWRNDIATLNNLGYTDGKE